eukprot:759355-Hanusia_phi.AAC.1
MIGQGSGRARGRIRVRLGASGGRLVRLDRIGFRPGRGGLGGGTSDPPPQRVYIKQGQRILR